MKDKASLVLLILVPEVVGANLHPILKLHGEKINTKRQKYSISKVLLFLLRNGECSLEQYMKTRFIFGIIKSGKLQN